MTTFSNPSGKSATLGGGQRRDGPDAGTAGPGDISGGTPEERPEALGPPIDRAWWRGTAEELLRRLPPFPGAGEGPLPSAVEAMATNLAAIAAPVAARPDLDEETYLRQVLALYGASTDAIREALIQHMLPIMSPAVAALGGAAASGGGRRQRPSPPPISPPPPRGGPPMRRRPPVIRLCADQDERYERFRAARIMTEGNIAGALGFGKTWEDVDKAVPREDDKWKTWHQIAEAISISGRGEDIADYYNCNPKAPPSGPGIGRRSTFRFGNAIHQELQRRYLAARPFRPNEVVVERFYFGPWRSGRRPRGRDLIEMRASERLDSIGALAWSMGSSETPYRLDIGDLTNLSVHEIKPVRSYGDGVLQLWQYCHNFNLSKYFDEQLAGANDAGDRIKPGGPVQSILQPIDLEQALRAAGLEPSAWERRWLAMPWMVDAVPGVIAYTLVRREGQDDGSSEALHTAIKIAVGAALVVLAIAAVVAILEAAPAIVALARQIAAAAAETAKAELITAEGVQTIGMTGIWDETFVQGGSEVVKQGLLKVGGG